MDMHSRKKIAIIGGGAVGSITALYLANLGYQVTLIDPTLKQEKTNMPLNASQASLGVLMGYVYRRSTGRSWRLRKRSMELWPKLISLLNHNRCNLKIETPLIQLTTTEKEASFMKHLAEERKELGIELLNKDATEYFNTILETKLFGGIISHLDGRINPKILIPSLITSLNKFNVKKIPKKVISLHKNYANSKQKWIILLNDDESIEKDIVVLCSSLGTEKLLIPLGHRIPLEPILGQVLYLTYTEQENNYSKWPAVLASQGINLILEKENKLLLGATIEPGIKTNSNQIQIMQNMNGYAPNWIKKAKINNQWHGIRAKPMGRPAPILETLESGLIINTGHYRNGILLAPACAEWVEKEISRTY